MFTDVVHEWERWANSLRGARTIRQWGVVAPALAEVTTAELRRPQGSARTDAMQAALTRLGQSGDAAAITTLLVQLRPGLGSIAAWVLRSDPRCSSFDGAAHDVRSTFHEVVMSHDLGRRPTKIAANVLLDTRQKLWRAALRDRRSDQMALDSAPTREIAEPGVDHAVADLDLRASVVAAIEVIGGSERSRLLTAELAYRTWFLDEAAADVARALGINHNAARTRLCRLRQALRAHVDPPLAA